MAGIPQNMTSKLSFIKIFGIVTLTAAVATFLGAAVVVNYSDKQTQSNDAVHVEETQQQNALVTESISDALERLRSAAFELQSSAHSVPSGLILHFAELEVRGNLILSVKRSQSNPEWKQPTTATGLRAAGFESTYLKQALSSLNLKSLRENGVGMIEVKEDQARNSKFLGLAFLNSASSASVALVLVDPMEAFPIFKNMAGSGSVYRTYLMGVAGNILAHSQTAYLNADFTELSIFKEAMGSDSAHGVEHATAIDRLPTIASWSKLGTLPLGIVVERVDLVPTTGIFTKLKRVAFTALSGMVVLIFLLITGAKLIVRGSRSQAVGVSLTDTGADTGAKATEQGAVRQVSASSGIEVKVVPRGHDIDKMIEQAQLHRELSANQRIHKKGIEEKLLFDRYETDARASRDAKQMSQRLAEVTSKVCKSPTLYFTYQEASRLGILSADHGFENGDVPESMTFPITAEVSARLQQAESRNEILSLTEYPPLARAIMNRMGIAHFEAWPVTGKQAGPNGVIRLQGVLVILQPGVDSDLHRESIARMMRATGHTYENALVSR